jgi:hypothetical protein
MKSVSLFSGRFIFGPMYKQFTGLPTEAAGVYTEN